MRSARLRDGLIAAYKDRKVRVRIAGDDIATVAVKGPRIGIAQAEFEYEIPIADAERMLSTICRDDTLEKERFFIEDAGGTWRKAEISTWYTDRPSFIWSDSRVQVFHLFGFTGTIFETRH